LAGGTIDALSFTAIRLISGAVVLGVLLMLQRARKDEPALPGSWLSAVGLFAYGICFSLGYGRLGAATGALILFAAVQFGMIGWGVWRGDRPSRLAVLGLVIAFAAFVALLLPGLHTPDPLGAMLITTSGLAWAVYSLRGRGSLNPIGDTAGNFLRAAVMCVPLGVIALFQGVADQRGVVLALFSGMVTSALGYVLWFRTQPRLSPFQAASVQLTAPVIAALGGVALLGEELTARLVIAGLGVLGGVALTIVARR
jgi:drug/metabolite transporter (DMT)-like permease